MEDNDDQAKELGLAALIGANTVLGTGTALGIAGVGLAATAFAAMTGGLGGVIVYGLVKSLSTDSSEQSGSDDDGPGGFY
jgi:zinc transporter ZupT